MSCLLSDLNSRAGRPKPLPAQHVLRQRESGLRKRAEEVLGPEELSEIAWKSGGAILSTAEWHKDRVSLSANADGKATTKETLTLLYQAILQDSLLELEFPFSVEKNESFQLKLSDSARHQWKSAQMIYSDNLIGCGSNSALTKHCPSPWLV